MKLWYRFEFMHGRIVVQATQSRGSRWVLLSSDLTVYLCWPEYMQALFGLNNDKTRYTAARKLMVQSGRRSFRGEAQRGTAATAGLADRTGAKVLNI